MLELCQRYKRKLIEENEKHRAIDNLHMDLAERLSRLTVWLDNSFAQVAAMKPSSLPEDVEADLDTMRQLRSAETAQSRELAYAARLTVEMMAIPGGAAIPNRHTTLTLQIVEEHWHSWIDHSRKKVLQLEDRLRRLHAFEENKVCVFEAP